MAESLWRRPVTNQDHATLETIRQDFIDQGTELKGLIRSLTDTEVYQAGSTHSEQDPSAQTREATRRMMSPDQLMVTLRSLTGFDWTTDGYEQLANDTVGYRVLGGGADGRTVVTAQNSPGLTWLLVFKRAAQGAASRAVQRDLEEGQMLLFNHVDLDSQPGDESFDAELRQLHWRLLSLQLDATRQAELETLWREVAALEDSASAWRSVLTVLFRDPYFLTY